MELHGCFAFDTRAQVECLYVYILLICRLSTCVRRERKNSVVIIACYIGETCVPLSCHYLLFQDEWSIFPINYSTFLSFSRSHCSKFPLWITVYIHPLYLHCILSRSSRLTNQIGRLITYSVWAIHWKTLTLERERSLLYPRSCCHH